MPKNIFAYTAPGADYPEFLSINREDDGRVTVTVRGPSQRVETTEGNWQISMSPTITMTLPEAELNKLMDAIECQRLSLPEIAEARDKASY